MKRIMSIVLSAALGLGLCAQARAVNTNQAKASPVVTAALKDGVLQFSELGDCVKNGNASVLSCTESLTNLNHIDREAVLDGLKKTDNALTSAIWYYSESGSDTTGLKTQLGSIENQIDSYSEENYAESYKNSFLQIQSSIYQIVKSSESLYFNILKLDHSMETTQRSLDALGRSVTLTNAKCKLGQASKEDLRALQEQFADTRSQLTALQAQSKTSKQSLQSMIGVTSDGNLQLSAPATVGDATIAAIDLDGDIAAGETASATIYSDQKAVDDAKDDWDDMPFSPAKQHTYQQMADTLSAAKTNFEVQATTLYQTLQENQRLCKVALSSLTGARKTYAVAEKKYEIGTLSKQDLLAAGDTLKSAQQAVEQAALNLSSAYASYDWVRLGIASA